MEKDSVQANVSVAGGVSKFLSFRFGGSGKATFRDNTLRFGADVQDQRAKEILGQASDPIAVYDTAIRTTWIVPKLSVILHMAHIYKARCRLIAQVPVAKASFDGGEASSEVLEEKWNEVLDDGKLEEEDKKLLLGDYVRARWVALSALSHGRKEDYSNPVKSPSKNQLCGVELMDVAGPPKDYNVKRCILQNNGESWTQLLRLNKTEPQKVLFCKNLGNLIQVDALRSQGLLENCHSVPPGRDFLVSTVKVFEDTATAGRPRSR
ncbi:MAG: hypothetical protein M1822_003693 [Bathelium mastoideum]|nr:MAG: hypothetical protein M1822_003693 [Bathelium mastoideum]